MDPKALGEGIKSKSQSSRRRNKKQIPKVWERTKNLD